jgi:hypothetical protein
MEPCFIFPVKHFTMAHLEILNFIISQQPNSFAAPHQEEVPRW